MPGALTRLLPRLIRESCPRCRLDSAAGFCENCRADFRLIDPACRRCGMPAPCHPCVSDSAAWKLDAVIAPFVYGAPLNRYLLNLKYHRQRILGRAFGLLLADEVSALRRSVDALIAVPLHRKRLAFRTFNQADEIASLLAARLNCPLLVSGISRAFDSTPQAELDRAQRLRLPDSAFRAERHLNGLRLAIVDDVITTGSTVNALAGALKAAGAIHVEAWAVARSIPDHTRDPGARNR